MTELVLKLDEATLKKLQRAAEHEGLSEDAWVTKLIETQFKDEWPDAVRRLAGAWPDFPEAETLRGGDSKDARREVF